MVWLLVEFIVRENGTYVKIVGSLRNFQNVRKFKARAMSVVHDPNMIVYHNLSTILVHTQRSQGRKVVDMKSTGVDSNPTPAFEHNLFNERQKKVFFILCLSIDYYIHYQSK